MGEQRVASSRPPPPALAAFVLTTAFLAVYAALAGHGFVKDDFNWIARSPLETWRDAAGLLGAPTGFFRPMVSLSFGVNLWMCGAAPRCFGLANLALAMGCAAAVFLLARALSLSRGAALLAGAIWAFNWHGINLSILWISGRTALILTAFACAAAIAFVKRRPMAAAALCLAAMLAKEEAVLLPAVLLGWHVAEHWGVRARLREAAAFALAVAPAEALYFLLRARSGAFTFATAPSFYRPAFTLERVWANLPAYFDRSATFALAVLVLWVIVCRPPSLRPSSWPLVRLGAWWWVGTLAIVIFLPLRSSLYVCLPSVATALVAASVVDGTWPSIAEAPRRRAVLCGLLVPFLLWPVYYARNRPAVREAELSAATVAVLRDVAREHGAGTSIVLLDDRSARPSLDAAFGTLVQVAADVMVTPHVLVWIDPPPRDAALAGLSPPRRVDVDLALKDGRIAEVAPSASGRRP